MRSGFLMSDERRYRDWEKKSKEFYKKRGLYFQQKDRINEKTLLEFISGCKSNNGYGFIPGKSPDIESTYAGVALERILNLEVMQKLQNFEFKICKETNKYFLIFNGKKQFLNSQLLYRLSAILNIRNQQNPYLDEIQNFIQEVQCKRSLLFHQSPQKNIVDIRSNYEIISSTFLLGYNLQEAEKIAKSICLEFFDQTGFKKNKLATKVDSTSTYNGLALIKLLGSETLLPEKKAILNNIKKLWNPDGFRTDRRHHPNIWTTYDIVAILRILRSDIGEYKTEITKYITAIQSPKGGFYSSKHGNPSLLRTFSALSCLEIIHKPNKFNEVLGIPFEQLKNNSINSDKN